MQFTDSHIHLQDYKTKNTQQIISDLRNLKFTRIICVSSSPDEFAKVAALADSAPDLITPAFGIHPWYISSISDTWQNILQQYLSNYPASFIGECGIDRIKGGDMAKQLSVFDFHLQLAQELHRPLNIHLVRAEDIFSKILKNISVKCIIHSFSGSLPFLQKLLNNNAYISLNPKILLRPRATEIIQTIPVNRLLVESDAPFQSDYSDIPAFIKQISALKLLSAEALTTQIQQNLQKINEN